MTSATASPVQTAYALAAAFDAYSCPRGCGELIYRSPFPDDPDPAGTYAVPIGDNEVWRHTNERCQLQRRRRMLARLVPLDHSGEPRWDTVQWDRSFRLEFDARSEPGESRGLGSDTRTSLRAESPAWRLELTGGREATWRLLAAARGDLRDAFARQTAAVAPLMLEAFPVVDDQRWMRCEAAKLQLVDTARDVVTGARTAVFEVLEGPQQTTFLQQIVDELPPAPPWWDTVDAPERGLDGV